MSFQSELETAYTTEQVKQWSRAGNDTDATTIDTDVIDQIEKTIKGEFRMHAGVEMDLTNNMHLAVLLDRAAFFLRRRAGEIGFSSTMNNDTLQQIKTLRKVTNSNTIAPTKFLVNDVPTEDTNESFAAKRKMIARGGALGLRSPQGVYREDVFGGG